MKDKSLERKDFGGVFAASGMDTTVSLGGLNPKWLDGQDDLEWYPDLLPVDELIKSGGYYMLDIDKVLIPYYSLAGWNPGHLVWDDFLPLFTLLSAFDILDKDMVLIRYDLEIAQWASCQRKWDGCKKMLKKFLPLMGTALNMTSTQYKTIFTTKERKKSKYVCSPNGASGLGMLTDHGEKLHGWITQDYESTVNTGRGGSVYAFRNWMLNNLNGFEMKETKLHEPPYRIVISSMSSRMPDRKVSFDHHGTLLEYRLGDKYDLEIHSANFEEMSLIEQIELISGASIFISVCGGGAVTGMFLPKGSSMFLYFTKPENRNYGNTHARLDWDLLNNMGYLRMHWLSSPKDLFDANGNINSGREAELDVFVSMIDQELDMISHLNDY